MAITTGCNASQPCTYIIIPGKVRPEVRVTADPDVCVSVNTPPTVYTIKNGELTIAEPKKEEPVSGVKAPRTFAIGGQPNGSATGEGFAVQWITSPDPRMGNVMVTRVWAKKGGVMSQGQPIGHDAQGDYVHFSGMAAQRVIS